MNRTDTAELISRYRKHSRSLRTMQVRRMRIAAAGPFDGADLWTTRSLSSAGAHNDVMRTITDKLDYWDIQLLLSNESALLSNMALAKIEGRSFSREESQLVKVRASIRAELKKLKD